MRYLKKWGKGKPPVLVMMAQQLTVSAESCFVFLRLVKAGERIEVFSSISNVKERLRLYRNHRRMQSYRIGSPSVEPAKKLRTQILDSMT